MINIVVVSHGNLAAELIKSAEMIAGESKGIYFVTLHPGDTPESFEEKIDSTMAQIEGQETLILIDLFSGTPYNITAKQLLKDNVECVTGANLPMLIEAMISREDANVVELAESISQVGIDSVKNLKPMLRKR
jgi:PTS system mannose-specific IIA component